MSNQHSSDSSLPSYRTNPPTPIIVAPPNSPVTPSAPSYNQASIHATTMRFINNRMCGDAPSTFLQGEKPVASDKDTHIGIHHHRDGSKTVMRYVVSYEKFKFPAQGQPR